MFPEKNQIEDNVSLPRKKTTELFTEYSQHMLQVTLPHTGNKIPFCLSQFIEI